MTTVSGGPTRPAREIQLAASLLGLALATSQAEWKLTRRSTPATLRPSRGRICRNKANLKALRSSLGAVFSWPVGSRESPCLGLGCHGGYLRRKGCKVEIRARHSKTVDGPPP